MARIGLLGGESTGKTTLATELRRCLHAGGVDEVLRAFVDEHGRVPRRDEQAGLLEQQRAAEDAAAGACDLLVADPAVLMTAVYSELYFDDATLTPRALDLSAARYDLLVWCGDEIPWTDDGLQHDGAHYRAAADRIIARLAPTELLPRGIPVLRVTGSVADRVASVTQAWQSGSGTGPT